MGRLESHHAPFKVEGLGFKDLGFRVYSSLFRFKVLGCRV